VELGTSAPDTERERADCFAVDARNARRRADAEAVTQRSNDFDLLIAKKGYSWGQSMDF
jgi:hypothetical protein